jgi:hypothetical protein
MTYATRSPTAGAVAGSRAFIRLANSTCACLPSYSALAYALVMTRRERSRRFIRRSEIVALANAAAAAASRSMSSLSRHVEMTLRTSAQLSRRTVSMPLVSILSHLSGVVHRRPAYRFLEMSRYGL